MGRLRRAFEVLGVVGLTTLAACDDQPVPSSLVPGSGPSGAGGGGGSSPSIEADIQFLSVSNWQGQLDPLTEADDSGNTWKYGGVAVLSTYFQKARAAGPDTLFVMAGDAFGATTPPLSSKFDDTPAMQCLDYLGLTADTFGNHNFDRGIDFLKAKLAESKHPFVSANMTNLVEELGSVNVVVGYHMVEVGGVKVALIGITRQGAVEGVPVGALGTIQITEPVTAANEAAAKARADGAQVVAVLAHIGAMELDAVTGEPAGELIDFAKSLTGIDLVFGDHADMIVNEHFGDLAVVQNRSRGRTFATVQVHLKDGAVTSDATITDAAYLEVAKLRCSTPPCTCPATACPDSTFSCDEAGQCVKEVVTPDPAVEEQILKQYRDQIGGEYDLPLGKMAVQPWPRDGATERVVEVQLGDSVADSMLDKYKGTTPPAQMAFINGGGLRATLPSPYVPALKSLKRTGDPPYDLVVGDAYTVLTFDDHLVVSNATGKIIWQVLERSVSNYPTPAGSFLQSAGIRFRFKASGQPFARVEKVMLDDGSGTCDADPDGLGMCPGGSTCCPAGKVCNVFPNQMSGKCYTAIPNDDLSTYRIVTIDYLYFGGDGYVEFLEDPASPVLDDYKIVWLDYLKKTMAVAPLVDPADWCATCPEPTLSGVMLNGAGTRIIVDP